MEHRLLHLTTMKFVRLKQLRVDALLSNFLIISKDSTQDYTQDCNLRSKLSCQTLSIAIKILRKTPQILKYFKEIISVRFIVPNNC